MARSRARARVRRDCATVRSSLSADTHRSRPRRNTTTDTPRTVIYIPPAGRHDGEMKVIKRDEQIARARAWHSCRRRCVVSRGAGRVDAARFRSADSPSGRCKVTFKLSCAPGARCVMAQKCECTSDAASRRSASDDVAR